jgi:dUTPase
MAVRSRRITNVQTEEIQTDEIEEIITEIQAEQTIEPAIPVIEMSQEVLQETFNEEIVSLLVPEVNDEVAPVIANEPFSNIIPIRVIKLTPDATIIKQKKATFDICANFSRIDNIVVVKKDGKRTQIKVSTLSNNTRCVIMDSGDRALIPTNLIFQIPENCKMTLYSKKNLSFNNGLTLSSGVDIIDSNYTDPLFVLMCNNSNTRSTIKAGDKIVEGEIAPYFIANFQIEGI